MHKSIVRRIAALAVFLLLGGVMSLSAIAEPKGKCNLPKASYGEEEWSYYNRTGYHLEEWRKKCPIEAAAIGHGEQQGTGGIGGGIYFGPPTGGGTYAVGGWSYGLSGALTYPHTNFIDRGSASGSTGAVCADVGKDIFGSGLRYAGEFSGFRIAATASACQGFGTATQFVPMGGFDGKTSFSTFFTAGGRVEVPLNLGGLHIIPFAGVGGAYAHVKVQAFPFESNSSWRSGAYWEAGAAVPVPPKFFGMGTVQGIDVTAMELYISYKQIDVGHQTLDGGAPTKTDLNMIVGGARIKY